MPSSSHIPTSFVPLPPQSTITKRHWRLDLEGALGFISFIVFALVSLTAVGMFLYKMYLQHNLLIVQKKMYIAEQSFNSTPIQNIVTLNNKIIVARELLGTHITMSRLLDMLSSDTPKNVRLSSLKVAMDPKGETASMKIAGEARDFNALVVDSRIFNQNKNLSNVIFSNIAIDEKTNGIKFSVSATVNKNLIRNFSSVVGGVGTTTLKQVSSVSSVTTASVATTSVATTTAVIKTTP